jgi:hypothetical protein
MPTVVASLSITQLNLLNESLVFNRTGNALAGDCLHPFPCTTRCLPQPTPGGLAWAHASERAVPHNHAAMHHGMPL